MTPRFSLCSRLQLWYIGLLYRTWAKGYLWRTLSKMFPSHSILRRFPVYPEEEVKGLATKRNGVSNFLWEVTAFEVGWLSVYRVQKSPLSFFAIRPCCTLLSFVIMFQYSGRARLLWVKYFGDHSELTSHRPSACLENNLAVVFRRAVGMLSPFRGHESFGDHFGRICLLGRL